MSKHIFPLAAFVVLCLFACHKPDQSTINEGSGTPGEVTKESLVGSYRVTKVEARSGSQRSDITNTWFGSYAGDCSRDDLTIFNPDESFAVLDGTVVCDESTDDTGTWKLLSKTQLKLDSDTAEIEAFTNTTLRLVSPTYSTSQQDLIFTYTRQ
jgi:hypothetical protein